MTETTTSFKYKQGAILRYRSSTHHLKVVRDPSRCIFNGKPAYLLLPVGTNCTFYREQAEFEAEDFFELPKKAACDRAHWFYLDDHLQLPISPEHNPPPVKFPQGVMVRHVKSGGIYDIVLDPLQCKLEATAEPAYAYKDGDTVWVRAQSIMEESGKFEIYHPPGHGLAR